MLKLLDGKQALVTGAARGIGRSIAETFAQHGARVVLVDELESVHEVALLIRDQGGVAAASQCDITDDSKLRDLLKTIRDQGPLSVLVNNAGVLQQGLLGMSSMEVTRRMMEVNVESVINLSQYVIRMARAGSPLSIINLASIAGTLGMEGTSAYSASKGAVVAFTKAASKELARKGIRMNALAPGFIDTAMTQAVEPVLHADLLASVRLGRIGLPQDVANCALFLASDLSAYVTGQIIGVDGGMAV
jgi:3-oxoacyl-[acyl-carrier protein] reductase